MQHVVRFALVAGIQLAVAGVVHANATWKGSLSADHYDKQTVNKVNDMGKGCTPEGSQITVKGESVYHHTIPRKNVVIFYTCEGSDIVVHGIGEHKGRGNQKYDVDWHDGKSVTVNL